ncbi:hypothetical protein [Paraburkholderia sacchari]|uniref:hypothetical protein n=1 Tax=Paraburkholderia sacchari TaxID=159450 RepID=UPI003D966849
MMTALFQSLPENYGLLVIAGVVFCAVQGLAYLFKRHVRALERDFGAACSHNEASLEVDVRDELDKTMKALSAEMRKLEAERGKLLAQFKGRAGSVASHSSQSAAYVGSLRLNRKSRVD